MSGTLTLQVAGGYLQSSPNGMRHPRHWILLLYPWGGNIATWYHIKASDDMNKPITYTHSIEANMPVNSDKLSWVLPVADIAMKDALTVHKTIVSVPPQRCQSFVVAVLEKLDEQRLLNSGDFVQRVKDAVEPSLYESVKEDAPGEATVYDLFIIYRPHGLGHYPAKRLATNVAYTLDKAKIPHVMFGWLPLALYGCREVLSEVEMIVPDDKIPVAIQTLLDTGYDMCTNSACRELEMDRMAHFPRNPRITEINRYHAPPAAHFHLEHGMYLLSLHAKGQLLWWMPELKLEAPARDDPYYILTTDERLPVYEEDGPTGEWVHDHPVKIIKPRELEQAYRKLYMEALSRGLEHAGAWLNMLREFEIAEDRGGDVLMGVYTSGTSSLASSAGSDLSGAQASPPGV
ncbi:hypothetical protein BDV18DRAFT_164653 [Aspergillus unguis]